MFDELQFEPRRPRDGLTAHQPARGLRLQAEVEWKVSGPASALDQIDTALPGVSERLQHDLLLLRFGNGTGFFRAPGLGTVEVCSGKWGVAWGGVRR